MLFISTPSGQQSPFNQLYFDECDHIHNSIQPSQKHKKLSVNKNQDNWAIDIAYQLWNANSNNQFNIHQWHIDVMNKYINNKIKYDYISKFAFNAGVSNYNIKLISDVNEFCDMYNYKHKTAYDLADLIVLNLEIISEIEYGI